MDKAKSAMYSPRIETQTSVTAVKLSAHSVTEIFSLDVYEYVWKTGSFSYLRASLSLSTVLLPRVKRE
jgi:hypothetical protein